MEMHTVKADRDVLELRLAESESDVKSLQLKVTELQREVSEMDALRARVAELKNLLAEQTQLTQDRQEEIQRLHGARLKAEERENELRREKEKAEAMAAMAAAEQADMDRLDALTAAWYTWQSFIEDSELDRMRERLCLNAASPLRLEGRLTPEASPPATPPVSPPKDPHLESIHEVSGERDIGSPEDERNGGGGRYSSLSAAFDQS
jgi:vacuolar-type H+-ATPase subunit I/STV1